MKILITGENSFVGRNFLQYSVFKNVEEISLMKQVPENIDFEKYDVVIHLVAIVHQKKTIPESQYFIINRDLCLKVAELAKLAGVKQFIFLSTVKVYGKFISGSEPWNEKSLCIPEDAYGKSKYEAELALNKLEDSNFTVSIIRTPLVYGEYVRANMLSIMKLVSHTHILPFKDVNNRRNFTGAENLVSFIDRIIEKRASGIFIAMDENAISTSELVRMISENLEKRVVLFKIPDFVIRIGMSILPGIFDRLYGSFEMDNSRTLKILDFKPPVPTGEGIKKMVQSFREDQFLNEHSKR
jgi:nucleoside-diphosphate-sugar epimerase